MLFLKANDLYQFFIYIEVKNLFKQKKYGYRKIGFV